MDRSTLCSYFNIKLNIMKNEELLDLITLLIKDNNVKSFKIDWNGDLGEYSGQIVKPIINIEKYEK